MSERIAAVIAPRWRFILEGPRARWRRVKPTSAALTAACMRRGVIIRRDY